MLREWLFGKLSTSVDLEVLVGDRVYQSTSLTDVPAVKPFLLYRFGTSAPGLSGGDFVVKRIQPIQIFVHDVPGDYQRIDTILAALKVTLEAQTDSDVMSCQWLEESEDLSDDEMHTITRFARYQLLH